MFADDDVVADLDEIIDLRAGAYAGATEAGSVERGVGADLDVVAEDHDADLRDFLVATVDEFVAEAIGADDRARLEADTLAEDALRRDDGARHEPGARTDLGVAADEHAGLEVNALADLGALFDDTQRADGGRGGDLRARCDLRRRVHARLGLGPERLLDGFAEARERGGRVVHPEKDLPLGRSADEVHGQEDERSASGRDLGLVLGVAQERKVAGLGGVERGDAADRGGGLPLLFFGLHKGPNLVCGIRNLHATMSGRARASSNKKALPAQAGRAFRER